MHWDTHPFPGSMVHESGDVGEHLFNSDAANTAFSMTTVRQPLQSNQRCHHKKFKRSKKLQEQKGKRHVDQWEVYFHDLIEGVSSLFCKIDNLQDHVVLEDLHSLATTHGQQQVRLGLIKKVEIGGLRCIGIHIHFLAAWCMNQGMWGNIYLTLMLQTRLSV